MRLGVFSKTPLYQQVKWLGTKKYSVALLEAWRCKKTESWTKKIPALRPGFLYLVMFLGKNSPGHLMLIEVGRGT